MSSWSSRMHRDVANKRRLRRIVKARDRGCRYCGSSSSLELDHVYPRSRNGAEFDPDNVVLACSDCNRRKGDRLGFTFDGTDLRWDGILVSPEFLYGPELWRDVFQGATCLSA